MKVSVLAHYRQSVFPFALNLASALQLEGAEVHFNCKFDRPEELGTLPMSVSWIPGRSRGGDLSVRRALAIVKRLGAVRPDWIIAEQREIVPALLYKSLHPEVKLAGCFLDYYDSQLYIRLAKRLAHLFDVYVDVCNMRLQWRQQDWPRLRALPFVLRQAPALRQEAHHATHTGTARIVFTSSAHALKLNRDRLARFLRRLCEHGLAVDWYLLGNNLHRQKAEALVAHPLYRVRMALPKAELMQALQGYDVGLVWGPMAEANLKRSLHRSYFVSAASNKVGEYLAAGLSVSYSGNPGLDYLPRDVAIVFDPTDPEHGADHLAAVLADRAALERRRAAALRYHLDEMNFAAQVRPLVAHIGSMSRATVLDGVLQ